MIDVIAAQHIERRTYVPRRARIYRVDQVKQRPARKKRARLKKPGGVPERPKRILNPLSGVFARKKDAGLNGGESLLPPKEGQENFPRKKAALPWKFFKKSPALKTAGKKPPSAAAVFLRRILPPLALLSAAFYFLFVSDWYRNIPLPPPVDIPEDTRFERDMISYAGIAAREQPGEGGEEIPLDMVETFRWHTYRVKPGDSVSKIAQDHAISMDAVIASNGMTNAKRVYEGQELKIPNMDGIPYTVKRGDSLLRISGSMGVPLTAILDANDIESDDISPGTVLFIPGARMKTEDLKLALGELFRYPVRGKLSSPFGWRNDPISGVRRYHGAIDLAAPAGTRVNAPMDGRIATAGYNATYGKFIILSHNGGFQTLYAHLSVVSVSQGQYVSQGTKIGEVGSTGYSTGPHLHFAVYKNGRAVNPLDFLDS
jgi:murein DD-endopeptidase MepM/ murein hydrolase activator NlpD